MGLFFHIVALVQLTKSSSDVSFAITSDIICTLLHLFAYHMHTHLFYNMFNLYMHFLCLFYCLLCVLWLTFLDLCLKGK